MSTSICSECGQTVDGPMELHSCVTDNMKDAQKSVVERIEKKQRQRELDRQNRNDGLASDILDMLMSAKFERWYQNDFTDFVEGEENCKSDEDIKNDIKSMMRTMNF